MCTRKKTRNKSDFAYGVFKVQEKMHLMQCLYEGAHGYVQERSYMIQEKLRIELDQLWI